MQSNLAGKNTSPIEVLNISPYGFWVFIHNKEYLLTFDDFPWFTQAKIEDIIKIELLKNNHVYWPNLDIDLTLKMIENPKDYPLIAKHLH